jgi:cell division septation protein DedD
MESSFNEQPELFDTWNAARKGRKPSSLLVSTTTVTLRLGYEHLVVIAVAMVMGLVASFALGIDRGQRVAQRLPAVPAPAVEAPRRMLASARNQIAAPQPPSVAPTVVPSRVSPTTVPATTSQLRSRYTIQIASYRKAGDASAEVNRLKRQGHTTVSTAHRGEFTIVLVGSYTSKREATNQLPAWRKRYKDCFIKELSHESTS